MKRGILYLFLIAILVLTYYLIPHYCEFSELETISIIFLSLMLGSIAIDAYVNRT
jgi:positive regulator of sigma E activity